MNKDGWLIIVFNDKTNRWDIVSEAPTLSEAEAWIDENLTDEAIAGKTKGIKRKESE